MSSNGAREGGGAIFYVVDSGWGRLTLNGSQLHGNPSGRFQSYPGVFDDIDLRAYAPAMIRSSDN
jgi:hypothetical protein